MGSESPAAEGANQLRQRVAVVSRWLHIYLSLASFAILAFFAVTGITLNHPDAFSSGKPRNRVFKGNVPLDWVRNAGTNSLNREAVVSRLRTDHHVSGALADFRIEDSQLSVSFRGPGYTADALIDRESGTYELTEIRMGAIALINDLHKGRDSGPVWSFVIDLSAILMIAVSITGLILLWFLKRRRVSGFAAAILGALACWLVYLWWVP